MSVPGSQSLAGPSSGPGLSLRSVRQERGQRPGPSRAAPSTSPGLGTPVPRPPHTAPPRDPPPAGWAAQWGLGAARTPVPEQRNVGRGRGGAPATEPSRTDRRPEALLLLHPAGPRGAPPSPPALPTPAPQGREGRTGACWDVPGRSPLQVRAPTGQGRRE